MVCPPLFFPKNGVCVCLGVCVCNVNAGARVTGSSGLPDVGTKPPWKSLELLSHPALKQYELAETCVCCDTVVFSFLPPLLAAVLLGMVL